MITLIDKKQVLMEGTGSDVVWGSVHNSVLSCVLDSSEDYREKWYVGYSVSDYTKSKMNNVFGLLCKKRIIKL